MDETRKIYRNEFYRDLRSWLRSYRQKHGSENLTDDDFKELSAGAIKEFCDEINETS